MQLQLETVNICNADCVFCPYTRMERHRGVMDMNLFRKIVDEASGLKNIFKYTLTGLGEPLLDQHVVERVEYIRKKCPYAIIDIYTNGTLLTEARVVALRDAGLTMIYVSLNALRPEQRLQIMRLNDFDKVVAQIDRAIEIRGPMQIAVKAVISKDLMEGSDAEDFVTRWGGEAAKGGHAFVHLEGNWAGEMYPMRVKPNAACDRALDQIMVLWDGRVSLCCFDGFGEVIFGDLNKQTIREVFNGEKAVNYRLAHVEGRRQELKLCATCTAI